MGLPKTGVSFKSAQSCHIQICRPFLVEICVSNTIEINWSSSNLSNRRNDHEYNVRSSGTIDKIIFLCIVNIIFCKDRFVVQVKCDLY